MKTGKLFLASLLVAAFFVACGDDVTRVVSPSGMETVSLGECSSETLGKMLYVAERKSAYVCGDSGWFPLASRREKLACDFEILEDSSGYRMVCDGDSVGVIYHGKDGADGTLGANGENGFLASCSIIEKENWIFLQVCGSDTTFLYQAICGGELFDPKANFCFEGKIFEKPVFGTVTDLRDSEVYRTVRIGKQTWMAEDLRRDIPGSVTNDPKACLTTDTSAFCTYWRGRKNGPSGVGMWMFDRAFADSAAELILSAGRLYEAESLSVSDKAGLCPAGFHLPDSSEWNELLAFVTAHSQGVEPLLALWANYGWAGCTEGGWGFLTPTGSGTTSEGQNRGVNGVDLFGFSTLPVWTQTIDITRQNLDTDFSYMYGNLSAYITDEGLFTMLAADGGFHYRNILAGGTPCLTCTATREVSGRYGVEVYRGFVRCVGD